MTFNTEYYLNQFGFSTSRRATSNFINALPEMRERVSEILSVTLMSKPNVPTNSEITRTLSREMNNYNRHYVLNNRNIKPILMKIWEKHNANLKNSRQYTKQMSEGVSVRVLGNVPQNVLKRWAREQSNKDLMEYMKGLPNLGKP